MARRRRKSNSGCLSLLLNPVVLAVIVVMAIFGSGDSDKEATQTVPPTSTPTVHVVRATHTPAPISVTLTATPSPSPSPSPTSTRAPTPTPAPTSTPTLRPEITAVPGPMVWVSRTGSKYHKVQDCADMRDPYYMTEDEAIAMGRKPCSNCAK